MRQDFGATVEDTSRAIRNDAVHRAVELTRQGWPRLGLLLLAVAVDRQAMLAGIRDTQVERSVVNRLPAWRAA